MGAPNYEAIVAAAARVEALQADYLADYQLDDGEGGVHTPTETEAILIEDAIQGLFAQPEFLGALLDWLLLVRDSQASVALKLPPPAPPASPREHRVDVKVSFEGNTYVARVPGHRVRRTIAAEDAVRALMFKLWGAGAHNCVRLACDDGVETWGISRNGRAA